MGRNRTEDRLKRRLPWLGLVYLCSLVSAAVTPGQNHQQFASSERGEAVIRCRIALVAVEVEVRNANGSPVPNLSYDQFRVYEDGKRQQIAHFTDERDSEPEGSPVKYTLSYYLAPSESADWEFRRIRVKVRHSRLLGLSVKCDYEGYFVAPRDWKSN